MEKLNEYLQTLLSSCSDELRLEPDKNPYLVSANNTTDLANAPLVGTQISTMVFPLIPPHVKSALPNSPEVEFVHPHNLGNFNFNVQKSSAGFIVTIRPMIGDSAGSVVPPQPLPTTQLEPTTQLPLPEFPPEPPIPQPTDVPIQSFNNFLDQRVPTYVPEPEPEPEPMPTTEQISYDLESSSAAYDLNTAESVETATVSDLMIDNSKAAEYSLTDNEPEIEIVSVNDPEFQTVFSDTSTYDPPGRRDDFNPDDYVPPQDETPSHMQETMISQETFIPLPPPPQPAYVPPPTPIQSAFTPASENPAMKARMDTYFNSMAELGASDLHMSVSMPPMVRKDGKMKPLQEGDSALTPDSMDKLLTSIMPAKNQEEFARRHDTDFAYEIPDLARFRCNIFMDRKGMGAVFRIIPSKMTTASQIGLSEAILNLCGLSKGLVVVTGPTGSGKSTTLCAMVNEINLTREEHIITIEDPIEFVHENHKCLVNQREIHNHTDSFKDALRAALREDPDIVLVGEMRDLETISIAIETAETGHLVFGTLHTTTAASTVDRIIDQFPADRQQQIRVMLSESLKGVIAQTLLPKKGGGRVAALEVLIVTPAISNLIREGKTFQIPSAMQTGKNHGMVMLNDALYAHVENGNVEPLDAYIKSVDKTGFESMLTRGGYKI
ncbi:MAG: type IV pilus twitching motility protein PilT [Pyrinomonadaceae bacterium]